MPQMLRKKPVFALPGCQQISVNTLLCDTLGPAELSAHFGCATFVGGDRKGTTKKLCDKDFAERSGELSGAIHLKTLVLLGNERYPPPELFTKFFGAVRPIFWLCESFLAPEFCAYGRGLLLTVCLFSYGGGTGSKKYHTQSLNRANRKKKHQTELQP